MTNIKIFLLFFIQMLLNGAALSQTTTNTPLPSLLLLPWETPEIDPDALRLTKTAREEITQQLQKKFLPNAQKLSTIAPKSQNYEHQRSQFDSIFAQTNAQADAQTNTLGLIPIWTRIHDYDLAGLVLIHTQKNTILALHHRAISQKVWKKALKDKSFQQVFSPIFEEMFQEIDLKNIPTAPEDLAVLFRNQIGKTRLNEVDRSTISVLMVQDLFKDMVFINPFSNELLKSIHQFYGLKGNMRKANREIMLRLAYDRSPNNQKLPIEIPCQIQGTDGVFGQTLPWKWQEPLKISATADNKIEVKLSEKMKEKLLIEREALKRNDLPQVIKIRGAWAYVDKGRAWGLQMNDRLISQENPGQVKGHVVAYFGPEQNLKSQRGWPIHEGAIVFIRKGQKDVKIGQILTYDEMKVPTPWPPQKAGTAK